MWFRFFTLKYIEINEHGFLLSNFIGITKSSQFFKQWPGRGTRLGTQWGPSLLAKINVYGKKSAEYDGSYLVNSMKGMNNYGIKDTVS